MSGVVRVVTGGGKTIFSHLCSLEFLKEYPLGRVVIVVPTSALLDQWYVSLVEDVGVPAADISLYSGTEHGKALTTFSIVVINSARTLGAKLSAEGDVMLVVDECHRAGSPENAKALRGDYRATLGLSATPEREYDAGFDMFVRPALGEIIFDYSYSDAARDGVISPFALHNVRVDMLEDEQSAYDRLTRRVSAERAKLAKGIGSEDRLRRILQQRAAVLATATMRIPVAVKLAEKHPGVRTIIFHERVDAADKLVNILKSRNRSVTSYHAQIPAALRRDNLRLYRRGTFDILVCCRALDEGINVPETAVAILASSTASLRQRIQRLGRVLRPAKGKAFADIYTIYASDIEQSRLEDEAARFEGVSDVSWAKASRQT